MKKLKTGDVVRVLKAYYFEDDAWAVISSDCKLVWTYRSRHAARSSRCYGERIAKVLKVSHKTVLVEVSK